MIANLHFCRFLCISCYSRRQHLHNNWKMIFLAATKQFYERFCLSVCLSVHLSVTPFSLCSCHPIIIKLSWVITIANSDVSAKGKCQKSRSQKSKQILSQFGHYQTNKCLNLQIVTKWFTKSEVALMRCPIVIIPLAQRSCWGVYWFHSVRPSVRPSHMPCPLCISYSYGWILFILGTNDHYHERVCRAPWPLTMTYIFKVIRPWLRKSCPLCSLYSSGWILSIFGTNDHYH